MGFLLPWKGCMILLPSPSPGLRSWALLFSQYTLLGCCGWSGPRVILHLSPTCVSLSPSNKYTMDAPGCMVPRFSRPLLPLLSTCLAVCCVCFGPHDSACLRLFSDLFAIPWKRWVAWCYSCFQFISQYAIGALGHMNLHSLIYAQGLNLNLLPLSPTCPPHCL